MRRVNCPSVFLNHLEYFINTYLSEVKGLSSNTVTSYKTAFKLLIMFMYTKKNISADRITFQNLTLDIIIEFLEWIEIERQCSISTRNQRLAALSSFAVYAQNTDFDAASTFRSALMRIPVKKTTKKRRVAFTTEEVKIILRMPSQNNETELRNTVLLSLMYATGARAQEICDLIVQNIRFVDSQTTINLIGKGKKARKVRIPDGCANMLKKYLMHRHIEKKYDRHVFSSQIHEYMTVSCVEAIFKKYVIKAKQQYPHLFQEDSYPPHCMRHTTASHMLESGIPLLVIKSFIGHASVKTTEIYAENTQAVIDEIIKEWNKKNFPHTLYMENNPSKESISIPDFLKTK